MRNHLKTLLNYLADDVLRLKRFISPIDMRTRLRKNEFLNEQKYIRNFAFMLDTIENCICVSPNEFQEAERKALMMDDDKYFELLDKVFTKGENSLTIEEKIWLSTYLKTSD